LILLAERLSIVAEIAQGLREFGGEAVEREDFFGLHLVHEFDQVAEIGVVAQGKGRVGLVTEPAIGIDRPAGQDRHAGAAKIAQHGRTGGIGRAQQNFLARGLRIIFLVGGKALAELLVDFRQLVNRSMQHDRQPGVTETAEQFLAFAEGIAEENGRFFVIQRFSAKPDHSFDDFLGGWELIMRTAVGCFHDQEIGLARLAFLGGEARTQLEVAGVKERFIAGFDPGHGAAEDMPGREQGDIARHFTAGEMPRFVEGKHMFHPFAGEARAHELRGRLADDDFAMDFGVVRVGVADENRAGRLRIVGVKPKAQFREEHSTFMKLDFKGRHERGNVAVRGKVRKWNLVEYVELRGITCVSNANRGLGRSSGLTPASKNGNTPSVP
jgi:hypothetical protein